jgi:hypothetical protein
MLGEARSSREGAVFEKEEGSAEALSEEVSAWFEVCNSWSSWQQIHKSPLFSDFTARH